MGPSRRMIPWAAAIVLSVAPGCASDDATGDTARGDGPPATEGGSAAADDNDPAAPSATADATAVADAPGATTEPNAGSADPATNAEPAAGRPTLAARVDLTAPSIDTAEQIGFPLRISDDGTQLVDATGAPVYLNGDSPWSMIVQLDLDETRDYLTARKAQGFNTLLVNLIDHKFSDNPPGNAFGDEPFASAGEFSQPVDRYFERAHAALSITEELGFVVLLSPDYLGYGGLDDGWYLDMVDAGRDALYGYGRYVGERFADLDNVIWVDGGDFTPPDADLDLLRAVRDGMVDAGATQLRTGHFSPEDSAFDIADWLDVNATYTYEPVYAKSLADEEAHAAPHFLLESQYEADIWDNTHQRLRSQIYEAALTGAQGSLYGHGAVWPFTDNWREALDAPGAMFHGHGRAYFESLPWWSLIPDIRTNGIVRDIGDESSPIVAAATPDRAHVVVYVPGARDVTVEMGGATGSVAVRWFDPANGEYTAATSELDDAGALTVTHPGENSDGDDDWVLDVRVT